MADREPAGNETPPPEAFTGGKLFDTVFVRGMALVEETAAYLDGPGREQARGLSRTAGLAYSAWSMDLTTRLMQAASWLVMQKAVRDGDMRREDAAARKYRLRRDEPALDPAADAGAGLPPRFLELVGRAEALFEQICRLDEALYAPARQKPSANPVNDQLAQLQKAAETGTFDPLKVWRRSK